MNREESDGISEVKHRHSNSVASLQCVCVNKQIILIYCNAKQKALICKLLYSKAPKHSKFRVTGKRENPVDFLSYRTGVNFSSRNHFANLGSFAKSSVPVEALIFYVN